MDGREVGPTQLGSEIAMNPGPHRVEASAPGREPFVVEGEGGAARPGS